MHMAPRAAAWVAWAEWTCNTPEGYSVKKERASSPLFFLGRESLIAEMIDTKRALLTGQPEMSAALS